MDKYIATESGRFIHIYSQSYKLMISMTITKTPKYIENLGFQLNHQNGTSVLSPIFHKIFTNDIKNQNLPASIITQKELTFLKNTNDT